MGLGALAAAATAGYEPVSVVEKGYVAQGYAQTQFNDIDNDVRPTYFKDYTTAALLNHKRFVQFQKESTTREDLGGKWSRSRVATDQVNLILYWVTRVKTRTVPTQTTLTEEKKVPVKLYETTKTTPVVTSRTEELPIAREAE
jgi:hypothetical protein